MEQRVRIPVHNGGESGLVVVVEPWAREIHLDPGQHGEVVLIGADRTPSHSVELCAYGLIFVAEDGVDDMELYKDGERWG